MSEYEHQFGGDWTEEKLERLRKYLPAYTTIFKSNVKALHFNIVYIDAFAGTGYRVTPPEKIGDEFAISFLEDVFAGTEDIETAFIEGSAQIALSTEPQFDSYIFIEKHSKKTEELEKLKIDHPDKASRIQICEGDANANLQNICDSLNWKKWRAVVFLDPYGMQVQWKTLESIANTKAIDLWMLVPIGMGALRMMTKNEPPDPIWCARLTEFFGTEEWLDEFYKTHQEIARKHNQITLFDLMEEGEEVVVEEAKIRDADFNSISQYFIKRLDAIFAGVSPNYLVLRNKGNFPMYILCFAAANEKGAPTAIKIADAVLRGPRSRQNRTE